MSFNVWVVFVCGWFNLGFGRVAGWIGSAVVSWQSWGAFRCPLFGLSGFCVTSGRRVIWWRFSVSVIVWLLMRVGSLCGSRHCVRLFCVVVVWKYGGLCCVWRSFVSSKFRVAYLWGVVAGSDGCVWAGYVGCGWASLVLFEGGGG